MTDPDYPIHYQIVSQCMRRSWLCGVDRLARKNYTHRKDWLKQRMLRLAQYFAVAIDAFAIMSNHFYLIVYFDPQASFDGLIRKLQNADCGRPTQRRHPL